jgi:hypothetical protein
MIDAPMLRFLCLSATWVGGLPEGEEFHNLRRDRLVFFNGQLKTTDLPFFCHFLAKISLNWQRLI